jgi:hypothetical protein
MSGLSSSTPAPARARLGSDGPIDPAERPGRRVAGAVARSGTGHGTATWAAVDGPNLTVEPGELVALLGHNGAAVPDVSGEVDVLDPVVEVRTARPTQDLRALTGRTLERNTYLAALGHPTPAGRRLLRACRHPGERAWLIATLPPTG